MGYAWDIETEASWGHTRDRGGQVSGGGQLFQETIPELIYAGARNGPPKTAGDYITDFLIEESNFSQFLQGFKSDADNYNVPAIWYKTIPFTAPGGELTKVTFNVDPSQMIPERNEDNNTFTLVIDKLPTPPSYEIDNFSQELTGGTLNNFLIGFDIKNNGEENGQATVKIYEGKYSGSSDQSSIFSSSQVIQGLNKFNFSTFLDPDVSLGDTYCGKTKKYELVVFDDQGKVDSHEFSLPLYSGTVRGGVEDLFGKNVAGATITASTGQTANTSSYGSYVLKGIPVLGKITITATQPEFSRTETREIELKIADLNDPCAENSLTWSNVDFVLKDQDVLFNITIRDAQGNSINAHLLATNDDWRFENDIDGQGPLPGMQPGLYLFTITAPGYKTIAQDVNAVPNDQNLEFTMEGLNGRLTDGGLTVYDPQLLWQIERGDEIFSQMAATKDGEAVILYTTRNTDMSGKLYFLDALTGGEITVLSPVFSTKGGSQACLDTSYDGNTTALFVHNGTGKNARSVLRLFDAQGHDIGTTDIDPKLSASECDVSPDGFYIYPDRLMNKGLYTYNRFDIEGVEHSSAPMTYPGLLYFLAGNDLVAGCPEGGGQCVQALNRSVISDLGDITGNARAIDSSQSGGAVAMTTVTKAYFFSGGGKLWEKDVITKGSPLDIAVSPGGKYVIYSTFTDQAPHRTIRIFTDNNLDKTPAALPDPGKEDVLFVAANDKGIFFATNENKTIKYYQAGSYSTDYNPGTSAGEENATQTTNNISVYEDGTWHPAGEASFYQLLPGNIYMANTDLDLELMGSAGSLHILEGTLFAVDQYFNPVLLKGQLTADFASPQKVYAIKFDRYDLALFQSKLALFTASELPADEYALIRNIHTKYQVTDDAGKISVEAQTGELEISYYGTDHSLSAGNKFEIDPDGQTKTSGSGQNHYIYLISIPLIILIVLFFAFRKAKPAQ